MKYIAGAFAVLLIVMSVYVFYRLANGHTTIVDNSTKNPIYPAITGGNEGRINSMVEILKKRGVILEKAEALVPAAELGAKSAQGFTEQEYGAKVTAYIFNSASEHKAAADKLDAKFEKSDRRTLWTSNGAIMVYGYIDLPQDDSSNHRNRLGGIISVFAGEE